MSCLNLQIALNNNKKVFNQKRVKKQFLTRQLWKLPFNATKILLVLALRVLDAEVKACWATIVKWAAVGTLKITKMSSKKSFKRFPKLNQPCRSRLKSKSYHQDYKWKLAIALVWISHVQAVAVLKNWSLRVKISKTYTLAVNCRFRRGGCRRSSDLLRCRRCIL
jgi:hypothetical protein